VCDQDICLVFFFKSIKCNWFLCFFHNINLQPLRNFYIITIAIIFGIAMIIQIPALKVNNHLKMIVFVAWAAYGIIPTLHWYLAMGGAESQMVKVSRCSNCVSSFSQFFNQNVCVVNSVGNEKTNVVMSLR
jgi:hypothetical protein